MSTPPNPLPQRCGAKLQEAADDLVKLYKRVSLDDDLDDALRSQLLSQVIRLNITRPSPNHNPILTQSSPNPHPALTQPSPDPHPTITLPLPTITRPPPVPTRPSPAPQLSAGATGTAATLRLVSGEERSQGEIATAAMASINQFLSKQVGIFLWF